MKSASIIILASSVLLLSAFASPQHACAAAFSGVVYPVGASIVLVSESGQKTSTTAPNGRYMFETLPDGKYTLQVSAPGYASDTFEVRISRGRSAEQNLRLLYISRIEGIDWQKGTIRATGRGIYPADSVNQPSASEMAKRAALSDAERNLLWIVEQIKVGNNQGLMSLAARSSVIKIRGYLKGFRILSERETDSGAEVEIELPLTGPHGLTRFISD